MYAYMFGDHEMTFVEDNLPAFCVMGALTAGTMTLFLTLGLIYLSLLLWWSLWIPTVERTMY